MSGPTRDQVEALYARYSFAVDHQREALIRSCFSVDARLGRSSETPTVGDETIASRLAGIADPEAVHHAFNIVVLTTTGDDAETRADFTMAKRGQVFAAGVYDDSLTRDHARGWVFARRSITYTGSRPPIWPSEGCVASAPRPCRRLRHTH